jgi:hypothetical protein
MQGILPILDSLDSPSASFKRDFRTQHNRDKSAALKQTPENALAAAGPIKRIKGITFYENS